MTTVKKGARLIKPGTGFLYWSAWRMQLRKPSTSSLCHKLCLTCHSKQVPRGEGRWAAPVRMILLCLQNLPAPKSWGQTQNIKFRLQSTSIILNWCPFRRILRNNEKAAGRHTFQRYVHNENIFIWAYAVNYWCHVISFYYSMDKLLQRHYWFALRSN